jgi:hypothetical protein
MKFYRSPSRVASVALSSSRPWRNAGIHSEELGVGSMSRLLSWSLPRLYEVPDTLPGGSGCT